MKKLFLLLTIVSYCFTGIAQEKLSKEEARLICAQQMAGFTKAVSGFYKKGVSYDQFQFALCGKLKPTMEGSNQLRVAYNFLTQGATNDFIIKTYAGKEVAASMNYLLNAHKKGIESDGSELFGGKTGAVNSELSKNAGSVCHWYQFWCLVQDFANWVVANWPVIVQIIEYLIMIIP